MPYFLGMHVRKGGKQQTPRVHRLLKATGIPPRLKTFPKETNKIMRLFFMTRTENNKGERAVLYNWKIWYLKTHTHTKALLSFTPRTMQCKTKNSSVLSHCYRK